MPVEWDHQPQGPVCRTPSSCTNRRREHECVIPSECQREVAWKQGERVSEGETVGADDWRDQGVLETAGNRDGGVSRAGSASRWEAPGKSEDPAPLWDGERAQGEALGGLQNVCVTCVDVRRPVPLTPGAAGLRPHLSQCK